MPKVIIRQTTPPDTTLQVNGVTEGTHVAGSTIGINLSDGVNPVTPDSVTKVGDNYAVVLPACPPAVTRSTATLMKTGQTTSYRTGDDGDLQAGRATDFLTLDAAPLHNDGSATLNTTTNRFTDINGLQVYGDNIVLDWSTWNGYTLLGYDREIIGNNNINVDDLINACLGLSVGAFASGWRLWNRCEANNIIQSAVGVRPFNYFPFNITQNLEFLTSTPELRADYVITVDNLQRLSSVTRVTLRQGIAVRTFSLSTSNILS